MACFSFFKSKKNSRNKPPPHEILNNSVTAVSLTPSAAQSSSSTSRSDGSAAGKNVSKSTASTSSQRSIPALYEERGHNTLRVFEFDELSKATSEFNRMLKIGEGGFGSVYKGFIDGKDGEKVTVAVKKLNQNSMQGHKQWLAEVQFLGVVEHPNLVKLIGYCTADGERSIQRLLVYEFMPNKSLEAHLFNRAYPVLSWNLRLQIALGAAQGLAYLHEGLEVQVIYRDFKTSNVLLDKDFKPKLSDFGLAREGPTEGRSHVSTAVVGTYGYAAPDYIETGHLTTKSDVWSFGVVLFEMLTGRKALERNLPTSQQKMLDWVKQHPVDSRKFSMIIDPRLRNEFPLASAREVAKLANNCLTKNPKERPSMGEVAEELRRIIQLESVEDAATTATASTSTASTAAQKSSRRKGR